LHRSASTPVRVKDSPRNLGVAAGRNQAANSAQGDLLLFLDDDAVLDEGAIAAAVQSIQRDPTVGAVAFNIQDPVTKLPALWFHPHSPRTWATSALEVSTVVGCACLVRAAAFNEMGGFWPGYFREVEEVDLSWRLLDAHWRITYEPTAVALHSERTSRHLEQSVRSNLLLVWRLFPPPLALRQTLVKLIIFFVRALRHRELAAFGRGLSGALALRASARSTPKLSRPSLDYLRRVHGPQGLGKRAQWSVRRLAPPPPRGGQPVDTNRVQSF